jgi:hypothetical protein
MKKLIISLVFLIIFSAVPKATFALSEADAKAMINTAVSPINASITNLETTTVSIVGSVNVAIANLQAAVSILQDKVTAIESSILGILNRLTTTETRITAQENSISGLNSRTTNLENRGPDFQLPTNWLSTFSPVNRTLMLATSKSTGNICKWNGVVLTQQVQIRGVAHFPGLDIFAVGTCDGIIFTNITNFPSSGTNIPVELDLFWQEKLVHSQLNFIVP